jgi:hypothetical protein
VLDRSIRVAASVFCLASVPAFAAVMLHSETTIPVPSSAEKVVLEKLEYRARFVAAINALTLELASPADADPVSAEWTFVGSNTDGQAHRVEITVRLLDEAGSQIAVHSTKAVLPPGASDRQIRLSMKVKPDVWKSAKRARIFADWIS